MYVTIRKYAGKGTLISKLVPPVQDGFVPLLKRAPGFKGYCGFASEDGHVVTVSVFDDKLSADAANEQARGWVMSNLRDLVSDPPEVIAGEVLLHDMSKLRGSGSEMFSTIRVYDGVSSTEEAVRITKEHIMPVITIAPGFRGYYALLDERDTSRALSVSLFDTREHAMAAQEKAVAAMRDRKIAPNPPIVLAGRVVLAAALVE